MNGSCVTWMGRVSHEWVTPPQSRMVMTGPFQTAHLKKKPWLWPFRIPIYIPMTISSYIFSGTGCTEWRGCVGYLMLRGHLPPKSPMICGSFAKRDLQLKASYASLPPCITTNHTQYTMIHGTSFFFKINNDSFKVHCKEIIAIDMWTDGQSVFDNQRFLKSLWWGDCCCIHVIRNINNIW